jgi:hypothetical protein
MEAGLTIEELLRERTRAMSLAAICQRHGYTDAYNAHQQTVDALTAEIAALDD